MSNNCYYQIIVVATVGIGCGLLSWYPAPTDAVRYVPKWKKQACEIPSSQNEYSHYVCDDNGDVKCLPGWTGDLCDVPICKKGCDPLNGYCKRPGECRCKLGFYGDNCNRCIPLPGCQHGGCQVSFECVCHKGWDGIFCSEPMCREDCHPSRGYCEKPGECRCRLGWSGPTCRECQVLPGCMHGTCSKPLECKCLPGWTGILCQTPICAPNCNREHGYCRRPGECRCRMGWMGQECSKCHPYPGCVNGDCRRPWECNCKPGWGGMLCDEKLTYCEQNPNTCQNGGKCTSLIKDDGYFRCECPSGFRGKNCEVMPPSMTSSTTTTVATTSVAEVTTPEDVSQEQEQMTSLRIQMGNVTTQFPGEDYLNEEFSAEEIDNET
ncbi:delta-like protein 1 [Culex quinquefasciatus]|uniref:delta-like protein 1 n=1 Tax=Culex quinquefasciatus TaxID=7176 RepID=UPI0018E32F6B|nr:delta-like protein 1 [Culex quinquefasciatus]